MLDAEDRAIVGGHSKRITLPMGDSVTLRQCVDILRGLCVQIDALTSLVGTPQWTERRVMMMLATEINSANDKIRKTALQNGIEIETGRPKGRKSKEQLADERETVIITGFTPTQYLEDIRRQR